jgi:hypothetical protein
MKKKLFFKLFIFAVIGTFVTFTSCKDYDDDIDDLQSQITSLKATVDAVNAAMQSGSVITGVTSTDNGITVTLSNGQSYPITNGADGAPGAAGAPGSVVTIGENGNWFIDGVDTDLAAQGPAGADGAPGADGDYYYPNEDGLWYKVDGETGEEEATTTTWLPAGTITAVWENGTVTLFNVEGADGPIALGNLSIAYLTLIPDFVMPTGSLPILNFSPLVTEECGEIVPATMARFQVSPSNASIDMIDTEGIYFKYNNPTVVYPYAARSANIAPEATFVSLEDGILTVAVEINTAEIEEPWSDKIDQLMLIVPSTTGGEANSDWMTVMSDPIEDIMLVNVQDEVEEKVDWTLYEFPALLDDAKALDVEALPVVELVYNETLDLLDVVNTWADEIPAWLNLDTYGLEYAFDLLDEDGEVIEFLQGDNDTDQQEFINLVGTEVSTRVYNINEPNPASINRTPIVHVTLMNDDCLVAEGFIKINIVEAQPEPIDPVTFNVEGGVEAGCEDFVLRVGTQEMNENFYAVAKVTKTFFHDNHYVWAETTGGVGTITEEVDPNDTESYNLVWTVTEADLWANIGKTITKSGTYTYGPNVIQVTFTADVSQPTADISDLLLTNYWDANLTYIQHNVAVPTSTTDADPANATFANNINNAFVTTGQLLDLEAANEDYAGYTYEYFFKEVQPIKTVDGITVSVSSDGKELWASDGETTEVVATILDQTTADGDILEYMDDSDLGKYLLNKGPEFMKATLYMVVMNDCGHAVKLTGEFDGEFDVHFLRPVNIEGNAADNFVDGVDFGAEGSILDIRDVVRLSDWRNYAKNTDAYYFEPDHENYYGFYDVTGVAVDVDNIVPVGLMTSGGTELTELPSTIEVAFDTTLPVADYPNGALTYTNNGAALVNEFTLKVPVKVSYKWGDVETIVDVIVRPTSAIRSAK